MIQERKDGMCPYFERTTIGDCYKCNSPRNPNQGKRHKLRNSEGVAHPQFMNYCRYPQGGFNGNRCEHYIEPSQDFVSIGAASAPRQEAGVSDGGSQPAYGPKRCMCKFWKEDEELARRYHCCSPGNPLGSSELFSTVGKEGDAERYRKMCRKADENGVAPACEYYAEVCGEKGNEEASEGEVMGKVAKAVVKTAVKMAVNPLGGFVEGVVDEIL